MSDAVKSWIEERRTVHGRVTDIDEWAASAGDALRNLPRALNALEQVLERHKPKKRFPLKDGMWEMSCTGCDTHITFTLWPCATVQAIEGATNE